MPHSCCEAYVIVSDLPANMAEPCEYDEFLIDIQLSIFVHYIFYTAQNNNI